MTRGWMVLVRGGMLWRLGAALALLAGLVAGLLTPTGAAAADSILYEQTGTAADNGLVAATSGNGRPSADDLVVPAPGWLLSQVDAQGQPIGVQPTSFEVTIYADGAGDVPGAVVASRTVTAYSVQPINGADYAYQFPLPTPIVLAPGRYWLSIYAPDRYWTWRLRATSTGSDLRQRPPGEDWITAQPGTDAFFALHGTLRPGCAAYAVASWTTALRPAQGGTAITARGSGGTVTVCRSGGAFASATVATGGTPLGLGELAFAIQEPGWRVQGGGTPKITATARVDSTGQDVGLPGQAAASWRKGTTVNLAINDAKQKLTITIDGTACVAPGNCRQVKAELAATAQPAP